MPRFAANLSMMFTDVPFIERFGRAAKAGFEAVEFLFPYDFAPEKLAEELKKNDLKQVLFNMPAGKWDEGERGMAAIPGREKEFRDNVDKALEYALALDCKCLHAMAGVVNGLDRKEFPLCSRQSCTAWNYCFDGTDKYPQYAGLFRQSSA